MKSVTVAFAASLAAEQGTFCTMFLVTRTDGFVFAATDHDEDLVYPTGGGGVTYLARSGYSATDIETKADLNVDNVDIQGFIESPAITEADLLAGLWDFADFEIFTVNWADLTQGKLNERTGKLGEVTLNRDQFVVELRGLMQAYTRTLGQIEAPSCSANLGDSRCKVRLNPPVWQPNTDYTLATGQADAALGSIVSPSTPNGFIFYCGTPGTSGGTEPSWTLASGGVTVDGSAVWESLPALTVVGTVDSVNPDALTIYDAARTEAGPTVSFTITNVTNANPGVVTLSTTPDPQFAEGEAVIISGVVGPSSINVLTTIHDPVANTFQLNVDTSDTAAYPAYISGGEVTRPGDSGFFDGGVMKITQSDSPNNGISREVKSYVPGQITLQLPFPYAVNSGDSYTLTAGCDKSLATCRDRYFNLNNFRGMPYIPGIDKITQVGRRNS